MNIEMSRCVVFRIIFAIILMSILMRWRDVCVAIISYGHFCSGRSVE